MAALIVVIALVCVWMMHSDKVAVPTGVVNEVATQKAPEGKLEAPPQMQSQAPTTSTPQAAPAVMASAGVELLQAFDEWSARYLAADPAERAKLIAEGMELARARRPVFKEMIKTDPRGALEQAVPMVVRQQLPPEILAQLEERVATLGELRVYGASAESVGNGDPAFLRYAETQAGRTYEAHVYGRREKEFRQVPRLSIMGVALDGDLALSDSPLRRLEAGEIPDVTKKQVEVCPVSGLSTEREEPPSTPVPAILAAVETAEEIVYLCDGAHVAPYENGLRMAEGATGGAQSFTGPMPAASVPSVGVVKVLYVPAVFADQGQVPASEATCHDALRQVAEFYQTQSYGRLTLVATVTPPVRLPRNQAWYKGKDTTDGHIKEMDGLGAEMAHAKEAARAMGYDWQDYHCFCVRANGGARSPTSFGSIGAGQVWMRNDNVSTIAHEVGHAFGLTHANFWLTNGASVIGPGGNEEYGDIFDNMGPSAAAPPAGHYNVQAKCQVRWLPDEFAPPMTQSGLYRIHAYDTPRIEPGRRYGLRVVKDDERTYWGEFRTLWTSNVWASNGLVLGWKWPNNGDGANIQLLDTTPGSANGKTDCAIALGSTFSDVDAGIHITTVAVNTSTTPPSLDVQVNLGTFPGNQPPVLALSPTAPAVPTSTNVTFTATASDPDGDALAYSWRWHDALVSPNSPTVTRSFGTNGVYTVSCVVSDMKGGIAVRNAVITVGSGGRYTIRGRLLLDGMPLTGLNVTTSGTNGTLTDSDGRYVLSNLAAGTYTVTPAGHGWQFNELFNNSVTVGPSFEGADFDVDALPVVTLTAPQPVAVEGGASGTFRLSRTGPISQPLTVSVLSVRGTATKVSDYTLTPDYASTSSPAYFNFTIPAGAADLDITVAPVNDVAAEGDETIRLLLAMDSTFVSGASTTATVTLQDNDTTLPRVFLTADLPQTGEGSGQPVTLTLRRTGSATAPLVVPYTIAATSSATNGTDYVMLSGTATIPAEAASTTFQVTLLDDSFAEGTETVRLSIITSASFIADSAANAVVVRIVDDDTQVVTLTTTDATAAEVDRTQPGAVPDPGTFLVTRSSGDLSLPLTVYYSVAGTALHGVDYEALPGSVIIPAGETQRVITIMPRVDDVGEGPETVILALADGNEGYRLGSVSSGVVTIVNLGSQPSLEVVASSAIAAEPSSNGNFRITAKGGSGTVVVNYTVAGTAASGSDYTVLPGSVTINLTGGTVTQDIPVTVINDAAVEELETVVLTLTPNPAAYTVWEQTGTATLLLRDDEQPTVFVDPQVGTGSSYTQAVAENASTTCKFYISRTGATTSALTVNYSLAGTATNGTDHSLLSGTATIPIGAPGVDVSFTPTNDTLFEGTETVILHLETGSYARGPDATIYITDDDAGGQAVAFATEGGSGSESAGTVQIPVSLTAPATTPVTVQYALETGGRQTPTLGGRWVRLVRTGTNFESYTSLDGTNWTKLSSTRVISMGNSYLAGMAFSSSSSGSPMHAMVDSVSVTGLSVGGSAGVMEAASVGTVSPAPGYVASGGVYRVVSGGPDVSTGTTDGCYLLHFPITNSANCTITARVLNFNGSSSSIKTGLMLRETVAAGSRHFSAFIEGNVVQRQVYRTTANAAGLSASANPPSIPKPGWMRLTRVGNVFSAFTSTDGITFTPHCVPQTLDFSTLLQVGLFVSSRSDGTLSQSVFDNVTLDPPPSVSFRSQSIGFVDAPGSHTESGGVYTINGSGSGILVGSMNPTEDEGHMVQVPVSGDFTLTARVASVPVGGSFTQSGLCVREGSSYRARAAALILPGTGNVGAEFRARFSATASGEGFGVDYRLDPGTLTFAIGQQTKNIALQVTNDTLPEPPETVSLVLKYPNGAQLGQPSSYTYTILDDDGASGVLPVVGFAAAASSSAETEAPARIVVTLSEASSSPVTVDYTTLGGTATGGGVDFTPVSGTLTFSPGETFKMVSIPITNDTLKESTETVELQLASPTNAVLSSTGLHTLSILDDDTPEVILTASVPLAYEAGTPGFFTFTRTGPTTEALVVSFTRTGTATSGTDYTAIAASDTFTIPAGQAEGVLAVTPLQESTAEVNETVILTLAAGAGYSVGAPSSATVTIVDDDVNTITIIASDPIASEVAGNPGEFTLTRSGPTTSSLNVFVLITGTATSAADYTAITTTRTFGVGVSSIVIPVTVVQDTATEGNEDVVLAISSSSSYLVGTPSVANVTIIDDDLPPSVFISSPAGKSTILGAGNGLMLQATVSDDGLPSPLTHAWTQIFGPGVATFGTPTAAATSASFSVPGVYGLRITVNDGQFSASDTIIVQAGGFAMAKWISMDQGPPGVRGISGESANGVLTLVGSGIGYTSETDSGHMMFRQVPGGDVDCTITARLTELSGPSTRLAGITIRETSWKGARRMLLLVNGSGLAHMRYRLSANSSDSSTNGTTQTLPCWLRLVRTGGAIAASTAPDVNGAPGTWTQINISRNIPMAAGASVSFGFVASAGSSTTATATAQFDNVSVTPAISGPALHSEDVGNCPLLGNSSETGGVVTINAVGSHDGTGGHYRYQQVWGDCMVTARVTGHSGTTRGAQSGVAIRDTMDNGVFAFYGQTTIDGYQAHWRSVAAASSSTLDGVGSTGGWVRLIRKGNSLSAYYAANSGGSPGAWTQTTGSLPVPMGSPMLVGLLVDSNSASLTATGTFSGLSIQPLNTAPDIMSTTVAGAATLPPFYLNATVVDDGQPSSPGATALLWSKVGGPGTVAFAAPAQAGTTATLSQSGPYTLRLTADDGDTVAYRDLTFTGYLTPFAQWLAQGGISLDLDAPGQITADADYDGQVNLLEYAFGTTPLTSEASPVVQSTSTLGADKYLRLTVPKNPNATDVILTVEATSALGPPASWSSNDLVIESNTSTQLIVRDYIPMSSSTPRFMRVKVERVP